MKPPLSPILLLIAALTLLPAAGCAGRGGRDAGDYQTVTGEPNRDPEQARQINQRAIALIDAGKFDEAEKLLKKALAADVMCGPAHNNLGKIYYHQHKHYLAAWEFQYASRLMPHHPEPRNNLGLVFEAVGRLEQAVESYAEARQLAPDSPEVIGNLARARVRRGDSGDDVHALLGELILKDDRPQWVQWARRQQTLLGGSGTVGN